MNDLSHGPLSRYRPDWEALLPFQNADTPAEANALLHQYKHMGAELALARNEESEIVGAIIGIPAVPLADARKYAEQLRIDARDVTVFTAFAFKGINPAPLWDMACHAAVLRGARHGMIYDHPRADLGEIPTAFKYTDFVNHRSEPILLCDLRSTAWMASKVGAPAKELA